MSASEKRGRRGHVGDRCMGAGERLGRRGHTGVGECRGEMGQDGTGHGIYDCVGDSWRMKGLGKVGDWVIEQDQEGSSWIS